MNLISQESKDKIEAMLRDSFTLRQVSVSLGIAKNTVEKYRRAAKLDKIDCGCGRPVLHKGWCKVRYQRSPARMKYWEARFSDEPIKTPEYFDSSPGYFGICGEPEHSK